MPKPKRNGPGRPRSADPLTESVMVRLTPAERAERAVAAHAAGQKLAAWMRAVSAPPTITPEAIRAAVDHGAITAAERDLLLSRD